MEDFQGKLANVGAIRKFLLAGRARFTVRSEKTGTRFTYRVKAAPKPEDPMKDQAYFVSVLTGPENETDYEFIGTVFRSVGGGIVYRHSRKSRIGTDAPSARGFYWLSTLLTRDDSTVLPSAEVWHEGICGRCGRTLTVPESIESGFGPECIGKV